MITKSDIEHFKPELLGARDGGFLGKGVYVTSSPEIANFYAKSSKTVGGAPNIIKVFVRTPKIKSTTENGKEQLAKMLKDDPDTHAKFIKSIIDAGYDAIDVIDKTGRIIERVVFNPKNVRSVYAGFDPDATDDNHLSS